MNKNRVVAGLIGVAVVIVIALGAVYLGSETAVKTTSSTSPSRTSKATTTTITSDDGKATLTIPKGALPETSALKKISISRTYEQKADTGEEISKEQADADLISYKLEPDGLKFKKPVIFTATIDRVTNGLPFLLHFSDKNKQVELVKDLKVDIDITKNRTSVSAPIAHFSNLVLTDRRVKVNRTGEGAKVRISSSSYGDREARPLDIEVSAPDAFVGDFIPTTILVRENNDPFFREEVTWSGGGLDRSTIAEFRIEPGSIQFSGSVSPFGASRSVAPRETLRNQPPRGNALLGRFTVRVDDHFRCAKKGSKNNMAYGFLGTARIERTSWRIRSPQTKDRRYEQVRWDGIVTGNAFSCSNQPPETGMSFEHTRPGVFSTVVLDITGEPGAAVEATLTGPAVAGTPTREITLESDGTGRIEWQVNRFGRYIATGTVDDEKISDSVIVQ